MNLPYTKDTVGIGVSPLGAPILLKEWYSDEGQGIKTLINNMDSLNIIKKVENTNYYIPTANVSIIFEEKNNHIYFEILFLIKDQPIWGFNGMTNSKKSFPFIKEAIRNNESFTVLLKSPSHSIEIKEIRNGETLALNVECNSTTITKLKHKIIIR